MNNSLEDLTNKVRATKDRISELKDEKYTPIRKYEKSLKLNGQSWKTSK